VALAGEIADGWLPVFFSPEHVSRLRMPLQEGAARAGRLLDDFRICPTVNVMISDDVASARDAMRPVLALYIGGMGSREQNFYNRLVSSYGFETVAREVQDLYLDGKRAAAMEALPDELIDMTCIAGPKQRARERLRAYRDAGVETLIVSPMAFDADERVRQLSLVAEANEQID
jgi:alkanesulfonate monooxygenase SsuD/methylene tetrahydromethanopterin reductase-like flavin-dependent oxidoreductase (luciferase family)